MKMKRSFKNIFIFICLFILSCSDRNEEQLPVDFVWDRVACEECKMALSNPHYSAQVIEPNGTPHYFDDIGCAILWLGRQSWKDKARTWVNDVNTTEWIEANKANWIYGDLKTPMGYGYAATLSPVDNRLDYETVTKWMLIGKNLVNENMAKHLLSSDKHTIDEKQAIPSTSPNTESQISLEVRSEQKDK